MKTFKQYLFEQHFWGKVGAGILAISLQSKQALVAKRSIHVLEPGTYGIIGGKLDDDEDIPAAAKREFQEETGYNGSLNLIPAYVFNASNFQYHNFIGIVPKIFEAQTNWETDYFKWLNLEELYELQDKHFGLEKLLQQSKSIIEKYMS